MDNKGLSFINRPTHLSLCSVLNLQRKIYHANQALCYFILNTWVFKNRNLYSLADGLHESDRFRFQFDYEIPGTDVPEYFAMAIYGARRYLIKEKDEDIPLAQMRFKRMMLLDKVCKTIMALVFVYWLFKRYNVVEVVTNYFGQASG